MKKILSLAIVFLMLLSTAIGGIVFAAPSDEPLDDYDELRVKWQNLAMGGDYDENNPHIQVLLTSINDVAADLLDRINPNPTPDWGANDYLWSEYILGRRNDAYSDSNKTQFTLRNIKNMAMAYQTRGCALYQNENLKNEILRALDYIFVNHYKPGVDTNPYGNWFTWEIGGPIYLCEATLFMYDHLTEQQIQDYAETARKGTKETVDTGANALWRNRVRMLTAILRKNSADLEKVKNAVPGHMKYTTSGDGYHKDGTFIQHNTIVYNGGYGKEAISDVSHFLYLLEGSPWEITDSSKENIYTFIYENYAPFMYNGVFMDMVRGREISRKDTTDAFAGITISLSVALVSEFAPPEDAANFKGMIKEWMNNDFAMETLGEGAGVAWYMFPVYNFSKILEIIDDDTVEPYQYKKSHQFGYGVRTVHATDNFTFGLAMYNNKNIANNETGDSNTRGWYTGTGTYWLYTPDIGQYTLSKPTMNWYRFPGTTVVRNLNASFAKNPNNFAGGTTLNEKYSASGLEIGPGHVQVHAKKSWFMFDNEIVAMGSDINSTHVNPIETIIDQHRIEGDNDLIINGIKQPATLGSNQTIPNADWALIEGNVEGSNIGVYFPESQNITAIRQTQQGRWTDHGTYNVDSTLYSDDYLTLLFDHGVKPSDASYSYVLLPGATSDEVAAYAADSDVEIIRQDASVHAVHQKSLNIVAANFFTNETNSIDAMGQSDYITVDKPSTVMVSEDEEKLSVAVTDTTQTNTGYINVTINRSMEGIISRDPRVEVVQYSPTIILKIGVNNAVGAPIETVLSFLPPPAPDAPSIKDMHLVDDTFTINFEPAERADGYILQYGTTSGQYTNELTVSNPSAQIIGLNANTKYYFAVKAFNKSGESPLSEEREFDVGQTRTLIDYYDDFSKIVSSTPGWGVDHTNVNNFAGDTSRLKRDEALGGNRPEEITYYVPSPENFELIAYDYGVSALNSSRDTLIEFFGSPDNSTWAPIPITREGNFTVNSWSKATFTNTAELDSNIKFIKIRVSQNEKIWAPQLSQFTVNYAYVPDRVFIDTMLDDSKVFESTGDFTYDSISNLNWNSITNAIHKDSFNPMSLTYSLTDIKNFKLSSVLTTGTNPPNISYETSQDGVTYSAPVTIPSTSYTKTTLQDGSSLYDAAVNLTGEKTTYLRLTFNDAHIYITNLYMEYNHLIEAISGIRYATSNSVVAVDYPEAPTIKIAPLNGYGEMTYLSSDEDIATVDSNGLITAKTSGLINVSATILGTEKTTSTSVETFFNKAKGRLATASSANSIYPASNTTNGNLLTRWQSASGGSQWLKVDLGRETAFEAIDISWQQYATNYTIQGSNNDSSWDTLYTETAGTSGIKRVFFDDAKNYRYVRINITAGPGLYSIFELRVLSENPPIQLVDLALNRPASCNGVDPNNASLRDPQLSVDGNDTTRWASARNNEQWFTVDLGARYPIYEIHILWEGAAGKEYKIQVSDTDDDWENSTTIVHETSNAGAGWKHYILPEIGYGRYVRMQGISRTNTTYGYSIFTFQVIGEKIDLSEKVSLNSIEANGKANDVTTTELTITLDKPVENLTADDFTVTGATKGALDSSAAPVYKLAVSNITVEEGSPINVEISKEGFTFNPTKEDVIIHKSANPFYIDTLKFKLNDNYISSVDEGNISLEFNVICNEDIAFDLNAIIAVYKNGKLFDIALKNQSLDLTSGNTLTIKTTDVTIPDGDDLSEYTVSGFVWDSNMAPLVPSVTM